MVGWERWSTANFMVLHPNLFGSAEVRFDVADCRKCPMFTSECFRPRLHSGDTF